MSVPPLRPIPGYLSEPRFTPGNRDAEDVDYIVVHSTHGPSVRSALDWLARPGSTSSYHYLIDRDGKLTVAVHPGDIAHHAGNWPVNTKSIGVSLAGWDYPDVPTRAQARMLEHCLARLGEVYRVPLRRATPDDVRRIVGAGVMEHREVPGADHTDCGRGFPLDALIGNARVLQRRYGVS